jgi:hypothetical protein
MRGAMAPISIGIVSLLLIPASASAVFTLSGRTSQGLPARLRVSDDLLTIKRFVIRWQARCASGATLVDDSTERMIAIRPFPHFHYTRTYTTTTAIYSASSGRKLTFAASFAWKGEVLLDGRARGSWRVTARVLQTNHGQVDICPSGLVRWNANLHAEPPVAGPSIGKTSQHGVVRVFLVGGHVARLIIELRTRCSDHRRRDIWPAFQAPFRRPQDAEGRLGDAYDILGRDAATGVRFRQRATFTARLTHHTLTGSAIVRQTLIPTGVTCKSPRVTFSAHL